MNEDWLAKKREELELLEVMPLPELKERYDSKNYESAPYNVDIYGNLLGRGQREQFEDDYEIRGMKDGVLAEYKKQLGYWTQKVQKYDPINKSEKKRGEKIDPSAGVFVFEDKHNYYVAYRPTYMSGVTIRKLPRHYLGYYVLGRAFPELKIIEIAMDLFGDEFDEVRMHEENHIRYPEDTEYKTRQRTKSQLFVLGRRPHFH